MRSFANAVDEKQAPALHSLGQELDRTGVISDEFKSLLFGWAVKVSQEAYDRGQDDLKKAQAR